MDTAATSEHSTRFDVVIIGGGLAGLSLARQLLLSSEKSILLLDKKADLPGKKQKVGESLVQVGGYYFAKVLQMEEHLLHEHFMKYNLRFYFKNAGTANANLEDYGQSYIRNFSNIPCYQLDRNVFEAELLRRNCESTRFELVAPAKDVAVTLGEASPHRVDFVAAGTTHSLQADWVVDTTGRSRMLSRELDLREPSPIRHGAAFMWVDGLVDIEKLTDRSATESRLSRDRSATGHLPHWLATNHFMFEGGWFWVIPLRGKTSLGLVFDSNVIDYREVNSAGKLRDWVCREFPLFQRDLGDRQVLDFGAYKDFAHGCKKTIDASRWAMSGESGRFTDPLYSPGSDFIAVHNSLIVDAIGTDSQRSLKRKCQLYEILMQSLYGSLLPTYAKSYDTLGDQEVFTLKYTWELSVYFSFLTYPMLSDLQCNTEFVPAYLGRFSRLGALNSKLQQFLSDYFQWKKRNAEPSTEPVFHEFTSLSPLRQAERMFYRVGDSVEQAKEALDDQLLNLKELARFIVAHIYSVVLNDSELVGNTDFIESIDFRTLNFDLVAMREHAELHGDCSNEPYPWTLEPQCLDAFITSHREATRACDLSPPDPLRAIEIDEHLKMR